MKQKDLYKWGYESGGIKELEKVHDKLLNNKDAAFTFML